MVNQIIRNHMKKILLFTVVIALFSCQKELKVDPVNFNVTVSKQALSLNDTAKFSFEGNPDIITFWSGEVGRRYQFKGRGEAAGNATFSFRSKRLHQQDNTLQLLISTDFAGVTPGNITATKNTIAAASWTNITQRATLPAAVNVLASSGNVSLADYATTGTPVYFAFKYVGLNGAPFQRWEIDSFVLRNTLDDGTSYVIANFNSQNTPFTNYGVSTTNPGFVFYSTNNALGWFNSTLNSQPGIVFRTDAAGLATANDAWAIIGPINLRKVTPDVGTVIKGLSQNLRDLKFTYKYPATGDYKATFEAAKTNSSVQRYESKELNLKVQ